MTLDFVLMQLIAFSDGWLAAGAERGTPQAEQSELDWSTDNS